MGEPKRHVCVSKGGWFIAETKQSCDEACQKTGLRCTTEQLKSHNGDVDSSAKVVAMINSLGTGNTSFLPSACKGGHANYPDVPLFTTSTSNGYKKQFCFESSPSKT